MQYKEICLAAYRGLVQPESEDKRIISAQWAKDDDINRFLRSLPNWVSLRATAGDQSKVESPEAVEQRNVKEARVVRRPRVQMVQGRESEVQPNRGVAT